MPDIVGSLAPAEQLRDYEEERLAEFARLMLRTAKDLDEFVRSQEAITALLPPKRRVD
jgi:hypothetical protein